jgi:P-loop containing NTP hydrolase pore-1
MARCSCACDDIRNNTVAVSVAVSFGQACDTASRIAGAGVGKGRQIAAVIKELWSSGTTKRVLWLSTSNELRDDARRDMNDLCARVCFLLVWSVLCTM